MIYYNYERVLFLKIKKERSNRNFHVEIPFCIKMKETCISCIKNIKNTVKGISQSYQKIVLKKINEKEWRFFKVGENFYQLE